MLRKQTLKNFRRITFNLGFSDFMVRSTVARNVRFLQIQTLIRITNILLNVYNYNL